MNKKILIGSIIAVIILTLVSFTSVVGYISVKSDSRIASPLFGIRANRAINNKQDAVTSDYIGKGKAINIILPKRIDNVNLMYKAIDSINKMNDRTFDRFLDLTCSRLSNKEGFTNKEIDEIVEQCRYIREYPDEVKSVVTVDNIRRDITSDYCLTLNNGAFPLMCFIMTALALIIMEIVMYIILFITHTSSLICTYSC